MRELYESLKEEVQELGIKVCGAGGGGCFILIHQPNKREIVEKAVTDKGMTILPFKIDSPL